MRARHAIQQVREPTATTTATARSGEGASQRAERHEAQQDVDEIATAEAP
jgi:hypothetical protein